MTPAAGRTGRTRPHPAELGRTGRTRPHPAASFTTFLKRILTCFTHKKCFKKFYPKNLKNVCTYA